MPTIRLFGRGKGGSAQAATAAGVTCEQIGDALAALTTASLSATWRCRHAGSVVISEGAVDFETRRSRATVIRGKQVFEYVRDGSTVLRAPVATTASAKKAAPAAVKAAPAQQPKPVEDAGTDEDAETGRTDVDADVESALEASADVDLDLEDEAELADAEDADEEAADLEADADLEVDAEALGTDAGTDAADDDADDADEEPPVTTLTVAEAAAPAAPIASQWAVFSDMDACGLHAYAEPAVLAEAVRAAGAVQSRKSEEFDGVAYPAFTVTLKPRPNDPNKVLARLALHLRDHGTNALTVTAFTDPDGKPAGSGTAAADTQDEPGSSPAIVRLRFELAHWTPAEDPTADHSVTVDLFELGEPVEIELPDRRNAARSTRRSCADLTLF